jgi:perosamine synthetase
LRNGESVAAFESAFASYVGAKYCIAMVNGTATLHTAIACLWPDYIARGGAKVATSPLTMSATSIAILHAGATPVFVDVDPHTWLADTAAVGVSLYGLNKPWFGGMIDDAAQTLRKHSGVPFTSYSFQASKILALGEGGALVTDSEELATRAREFSSLGYRMRADQPRIDPAVLKDPAYERHHTYPAFNYRMNDITASEGLKALGNPLGALQEMRWCDALLSGRRKAAGFYRQAIAGCSWITPQHVPEGWTHDYWTFAIALESASLWHPFVDAIVRHGGEMPFAAWRLTYQEPAFRHLAEDGCCPVAESLQPRLVQFQTNSLVSAERNAEAVGKAIKEIGG